MSSSKQSNRHTLRSIEPPIPVELASFMCLTGPQSSITISPLEPEDAPSVRQLLVDGLTDRWGTYESRFNPDIESFLETYQNSLVLVAKDCGRIVGTGTLRPLGIGTAELVRMSVARSHRRREIGSRLLNHLRRFARENGFHELNLETTTSWTSAVEFYSRHGFQKTHEKNGDSYFVLKNS